MSKSAGNKSDTFRKQTASFFRGNAVCMFRVSLMMGKVLVYSTDVNHVQKKLCVAIKQYLRFLLP